MHYYSKVRSFLINKFYNRIRFIRYPVNYMNITTKNLIMIKKLSEKINYREKKLRKIIPNLINFDQVELDNLKENGFLVLKKERLSKIKNFDEIFFKLKQKFDKSVKDNDFVQGTLFKFLNLTNVNDEELERVINIFIPLASHYLNVLPVHSYSAFWYSEPQEKKKEFSGSQLPHFDWEDLNQVKIFLPFSNIADENGPIHILPKKDSEKIKNLLKEKKIEINSKLDENLFSNYKFIKMNLNEGDILVVDTSVCFHFGGRCTKDTRKQLLVQFNDPFSMMYPIIRFGLKKDLIRDYNDISYAKVKLSKKKTIF